MKLVQLLTSKTIALSGLATIAILFVVVAVYIPKQKARLQTNLASLMAECKAIPNGSTIRVRDTTRMFLSIPKVYYPDVHLTTISSGATAGYISNAGPYGEAAASGVSGAHC